MELEKIKIFCDNYFHIDIAKKSRKRQYNDARYMYYYLAFKYGKNKTYENIGLVVNKDHASVNHGLNEFRTLMKMDLGFNDTFTRLEETMLKLHKLKNTPIEYIINPNTHDYISEINVLKKRVVKLTKSRDYYKYKYQWLFLLKNREKQLANE